MIRWITISRSGPLHIASIHQVAPASFHSCINAAFFSRSSPYVSPSTTMSNGVDNCRLSLIQATISRISCGVTFSNAPPLLSLAGNKPSYFTTRRIDFGCGQAPTTQIGTLGVCNGGGGWKKPGFFDVVMTSIKIERVPRRRIRPTRPLLLRAQNLPPFEHHLAGGQIQISLFNTSAW